MTHRQIAYWDDSVTLWSHAVQVTRNNYVAEDHLGGALLADGQIEAAMPHFYRATAINPDDPDSNLNIGGYEQQQKSFPQAIAQYKKVISVTQDSSKVNADERAKAFNNMGYAYRELGDLPHARESFEAAVAANPQYVKAWIGLELVEQKSRNLSSAIQAFSQAMKLQPSDWGYLLLARTLERSGDKNAALAAMRQARSMSRNFESAQRRADQLSTTQSKRSITDKDLFRFQWVADPQASPDGSQVVFVRVSVNEKKDGYDTSLWKVTTNGQGAPVRLTNGKHDSSPRWSLDGKWIAFVRGSNEPPKDGKRPASQVALLSLQGGEAWTITDLPRAVANPAWSPNGKRLAFLCDANADDLTKKQKKEAGGEPEHESDVNVITRAIYRSNDAGYLDSTHNEHIWIIDVPGSSEAKTTPSQLTKGNFDESEAAFTPDGSRIIFHTDQNVEPYYELPTDEIMSVPTAGGAVQLLATVHLGGLLDGIGGMTLSPDGKRIAFAASVEQPVRSYSQPDLWVLDLQPGATPKNLTADYDFDLNSGVFGDNGSPRAGGHLAPAWSKDGSHLLDVVAKQGRSILVSVDATSGKVEEISRGNQAVGGFTTSADGNVVVINVSTPP